MELFLLDQTIVLIFFFRCLWIYYLFVPLHHEMKLDRMWCPGILAAQLRPKFLKNCQKP